MPACLYFNVLLQHDGPLELPALPEQPAALVRLRRVAQDQCRPPSGRSWRGGRGCRRRRPEEETVLCGRRRASSCGRGVHGVSKVGTQPGKHLPKPFPRPFPRGISEGGFRGHFSFMVGGFRLFNSEGIRDLCFFS